MTQQTLAMAVDQGEGFEPYRKQTTRDVFLATMELIVLWQALCSVIELPLPQSRQRAPTDRARMHAAGVLRAARRCAALWALIWGVNVCLTGPRC
jgi:hypothetical protein